MAIKPGFKKPPPKKGFSATVAGSEGHKTLMGGNLFSATTNEGRKQEAEEILNKIKQGKITADEGAMAHYEYALQHGGQLVDMSGGGWGSGLASAISGAVSPTVQTILSPVAQAAGGAVAPVAQAAGGTVQTVVEEGYKAGAAVSGGIKPVVTAVGEPLAHYVGEVAAPITHAAGEAGAALNTVLAGGAEAVTSVLNPEWWGQQATDVAASLEGFPGPGFGNEGGGGGGDGVGTSPLEETPVFGSREKFRRLFRSGRGGTMLTGGRGIGGTAGEEKTLLGSKSILGA